MADTSTNVIINIPDYSPFFQSLIKLATDVTTATIVPAATLSTSTIGSLGLMTVSNTVTVIGSVFVGMVVNCEDVQPGTVVLSTAPAGPSWKSWYVNNAQELNSRPVTGLSPLVSLASNTDKMNGYLKVLAVDGIRTNSWNWMELINTYSWFIQNNHTLTPEKLVDADFHNFIVSVNSVTNHLPRFL